MLIKNSEENTMFIIGEGTAILSSASYPYTIEAEGNNGYTELPLEYKNKEGRIIASYNYNVIIYHWKNNSKQKDYFEINGFMSHQNLILGNKAIFPVLISIIFRHELIIFQSVTNHIFSR